MPDFLNQFLNKVADSLPNVFTAVLILIVSLYIAQLLSNLLKKMLTRQKADREVTLLLAQLTRWSIVAIGVITALQRFFNVTAFLTGLGILGFTVGFALKKRCLGRANCDRPECQHIIESNHELHPCGSSSYRTARGRILWFRSCHRPKGCAGGHQGRARFCQ